MEAIGDDNAKHPGVTGRPTDFEPGDLFAWVAETKNHDSEFQKAPALSRQLQPENF
jgi:hypothetical protein